MYRRNNYGIDRNIVDFFVILGAIITIYIAYINTLNYKANVKSIENSVQNTCVQEKIYELQKEIKEELMD